MTRMCGAAFFLLLAWGLPCPPLQAAEVPALFTYQGRVAVQGTNFTGIGHFKFALVGADGASTYWSHDQSSTQGGEPSTALSIPVTRGLFYVAVGDTNVTGMAPLPPHLFREHEPRLRVWFSDGSGPFEQLVPDHALGSVPYALVAGEAAAGSVGAMALDPEVFARFVDASGDVMTGPLQLPADGLRAGDRQLVLNDGRLGVGTASPSSPLTVVGEGYTGAFVFEAFSGTNRVGWARRK